MTRFSFALILLFSSMPPSAAKAEDPFQAIPVPMATLYPGDVIDRGVLKPRRYRKTWLSRVSVAVEASQVLGKTVKRTLPRGRPIPLHAIGPDDLVKRGEPVQATISAGGLAIVATLVPLEDGVEHDIVRLRNPVSGVQMRGVVQGDGTVRLQP